MILADARSMACGTEQIDLRRLFARPSCCVFLDTPDERYLIVETKGYDPLAEVKAAAAQRWVRAVTADGAYGSWHYVLARSVASVREALDRVQVEV